MQILLADDHKLLRDGLRPLLGKVHAQAKVIEASGLLEAVEAAQEAGGVELALLDLRMPGMNGLAGLTLFMERFPATRVVLLSAFGDSETVLAAIKAGAAGFIPKTIGGRGFVNALRLILSGEVYVPSNVLLDVSEQLAPAPAPVPAPAAPVPDAPGRTDDAGGTCCSINAGDFTDRERDVMRLLVDGLPNKTIARQLGLQEPTVKACLRGFYRKIGAANRAQAVKVILAIEGRLR